MLTLCLMLWYTYCARNYAGMIRTGLAACKTSAMHAFTIFTDDCMAETANNFGKWLAIWQFWSENGQRPVVIFNSDVPYHVSMWWTLVPFSRKFISAKVLNDTIISLLDVLRPPMYTPETNGFEMVF